MRRSVCLECVARMRTAQVQAASKARILPSRMPLMMESTCSPVTWASCPGVMNKWDIFECMVSNLSAVTSENEHRSLNP